MQIVISFDTTLTTRTSKIFVVSRERERRELGYSTFVSLTKPHLFNVKSNLLLRNHTSPWDLLSPRMLPTTTTSIPLLRRIGRRKVVAYEDGNLSTMEQIPTIQN